MHLDGQNVCVLGQGSLNFSIQSKAIRVQWCCLCLGGDGSAHNILHNTFVHVRLFWSARLLHTYPSASALPSHHYPPSLANFPSHYQPFHTITTLTYGHRGRQNWEQKVQMTSTQRSLWSTPTLCHRHAVSSEHQQLAWVMPSAHCSAYQPLPRALTFSGTATSMKTISPPS